MPKPVIKNIDTLQALKYGYMDISTKTRAKIKHSLQNTLMMLSNNPYPQVYDTYHEIEQLKKIAKKCYEQS
jgi:hypothetical protein